MSEELSLPELELKVPINESALDPSGSLMDLDSIPAPD